MKFYEIHNLAQPDAVNHIADDARQQQRERHVQPRLAGRSAPEITEHEQGEEGQRHVVVNRNGKNGHP